jgi:hypothetical protein
MEFDHLAPHEREWRNPVPRLSIGNPAYSTVLSSLKPFLVSLDEVFHFE